MSVAGKVDTQQWNVQREGDGVPGVSVLCTAMKKHQLWLANAPLQCGQLASVSHGNKLARDGGLLKRDAIFSGVFVKHAEFVIRNSLGHNPTVVRAWICQIDREPWHATISM